MKALRYFLAAGAAAITLATAVAGPFAVSGGSAGGGGGSGTVTSVGVTTANGVSGSTANPTTAPRITLTLGSITPTAVTTGTVTATSIVGTLTGVTGTLSSPTLNTPTLVAPALGTPTSGVATNLTGTASGLTAGNVTTNANLTGDVTSVGNATTVVKINGTSLAGLATGLLKNTTTTGVPSIAVSGTDVKTINGTSLLGSGNLTISGGNVTSTGASGAEPGSPSSGDVYLPSDGYVEERYSGSAWEKWGPIWKLTDPNLQSWTWVNQGTATQDTSHSGAITLTGQVGSNTDNLRMLVKAVPGSTPYTITALFSGTFWLKDYFPFFIAWRESGTGKVTIGGVQTTSTGDSWFVQRWNSATSFNSTQLSITTVPRNQRLMWVRIADNGTNRTVSMSSDGYHWLQIFTEARGNFFTTAVDQVGWGIGNNNDTYAPVMTLLSWKEE